jgi:hypothetical protein
MTELYLTIMSIGGVLTLFGIFLLWIISRELETKFLESTRISTLILVGGVITALGFTVGGLGKGSAFNTLTVILVLLGPVIIGYSLMESRVIKPTWELGLQSTLITLSLLMVSGNELNHEVVDLGSLLSIILLINGLRYLGVTPRGPKLLLRAAAWGLVLFSWLRYLRGSGEGMMALDLTVYLLATVLWVSASILVLVDIRELPTVTRNERDQKAKP